MDIQNKGRNRTTHFLIGSFTLLLLLSIVAFTCFGYYMSIVGKEAIDKVGSLYMTGIDDQMSAHFRTLMLLKLEQAESIMTVSPSDTESIEELYDELVYRASTRNFNYLALCSEDGTLEMLYGEQIHLIDPEPFYESLKRGEKKVAVGKDISGNEVVLFGISAEYPVKGGGESMALVTALPIEYISTMLSTDETDSLVASYIIRQDGSFIVSDLSTEYHDYFDSLYKRYGKEDNSRIDAFIQELSVSMGKKEEYSSTHDFGSGRLQVYGTPMPYSEWYLVTILPFGILNETVEDMNQNRTIATILVIAIILTVLLAIFYIYFKMNRQQLMDLEAARQDALEANKAKSLFLSNMSHDIRTPMNAIVGMTAIATTHIDDKEQVRSCLRKISLSGRHLLGLINDVLDMSKIESGKMTLTEERVSLREVVEGIVSIVQGNVKAKSQNFNVHIDNIIAEDVYSDSVRLNQVLLNLLSNAIKYTQEGGAVQLSLFQEDAPAHKGDKYIRTHIVVRDNGIGMTEEFLRQIFDPYSRADSKRVQRTEGTGLGMAITKYIVDAMDGTIQVESEPNKGTEFHIVLDLEKADAQDINMVLPAWKMLVVDDDALLCHTAVEALTSIGLQADWTLSGTKALEMITEHHRTGDDYQIILLDWKLPDMDGLLVARQIRRIITADMPIILISAYDWSDFETEARSAGISGFISKPLFKSTLFHSLKKYMDIEEVPETKDSETDLAGRRILVAEDNELNWEIVNELLSDMGIKTEWAENGRLCLEKYQNSEKGFYDAILMDVRMPVMDGYSSTRAIRALNRPDARTIPIIAMTADAFSEDVRKCLECGMNAHTAKPINIEEVISLLKKYILPEKA